VLDIKEEEVTKTVFDNRSSDEENGVANDRFKKVEGYHAVPPPLIGNYMPPKPDLVFTPEPIPAKIDFVKAGDFIKHVKHVESVKHGHPHQALKNKGIVDSGCSRHMTGNKAYLADYQKIHDGGKEVSDQHYIVLPLWSSISSTYKCSDDKPADDKPKDDTSSKTIEEPVNKDDQAYKDELVRLMSQEKEASDAADALRKEFEQGYMYQRGVTKDGSTNSFNTVSNPVNAASTSGTLSDGGPSSPYPDAFIPANTLLHVNQDDS
nr:hypothetical protein [Tanacetum cinerariifolium]